MRFLDTTRLFFSLKVFFLANHKPALKHLQHIWMFSIRWKVEYFYDLGLICWKKLVMFRTAPRFGVGVLKLMLTMMGDPNQVDQAAPCVNISINISTAAFVHCSNG